MTSSPIRALDAIPDDVRKLASNAVNGLSASQAYIMTNTPADRSMLRKLITDAIMADRANHTARADVAEGLRRLRADGWMVAVHNDYRQDGEFRTFWLFTHPSGVWTKGEGATDEEALAAALAASPSQGISK